MNFVNEHAGVAADEATLIQRAQADPVQFDQLYQLYLKRVYRYARSFVNNDEDAADVTQQVFLQALQALSGYAPGSSFSAWIFRIAHHAIIDRHRRRRSILSWESIPEMAHPRDELTPEMAAIQHEAVDHLHAILARLANEKRELIALRFAAQLSIAEIAVVVGKKPEAVKKQIARILRSLKEHYHDA